MNAATLIAAMDERALLEAQLKHLDSCIAKSGRALCDRHGITLLLKGLKLRRLAEEEVGATASRQPALVRFAHRSRFAVSAFGYDQAQEQAA